MCSAERKLLELLHCVFGAFCAIHMPTCSFPPPDCNTGTKMIGKILSHLLGSAGEDFETAEDANHELMEFEEGGWVIVDVQGEKRTRPERTPTQSFIHTRICKNRSA